MRSPWLKSPPPEPDQIARKRNMVLWRTVIALRIAEMVKEAEQWQSLS